MTPLLLGLVVLVQAAQVAGQVLLKVGMTRTDGRASAIAGGVAMLSVWFLGWLKLLEHLDLSYLYPFEGLSLVLLVLASRIFLDERMRGSTGFGVALIAAGILLVGFN